MHTHHAFRLPMLRAGRLRLACRFVVCCGLAMSFCGPSGAADPVSFRSQIAPLLLDNCVACHGAKKAEGGYRVDTFTELLKAGDSGETPVARAEGETSELLRRLSADEFERMPAENDALSEEQIRLVSEWIASGAKFDGENAEEQLAFVIPPPTHPAPPEAYPTTMPVTALAFSPDGSLALAGGYHEITVWNRADGKLVRRIQNLGQRIFAIAVDPQANLLAVACGEPGRSGEVRLVDWGSGDVKGVLARSTEVATDVAFRPGSDEIAVASADNLVRITNGKTLETVRTLASHADRVDAIAWSDDGSRLVSASRDKSAKVFDAVSGELLVSYQGHAAAVHGVAFVADGKQVVSAGADNKLHRWEVEGGKAVATVPLGGEGFKLVRGDGFVLVPCADRRLLKIDLSKNQVAQVYSGHEDWVLSAGLDQVHSQVIGGAYNGQIRLWNMADGTLVNAWTAAP